MLSPVWFGAAAAFFKKLNWDGQTFCFAAAELFVTHAKIVMHPGSVSSAAERIAFDEIENYSRPADRLSLAFMRLPIACLNGLFLFGRRSLYTRGWNGDIYIYVHIITLMQFYLYGAINCKLINMKLVLQERKEGIRRASAERMGRLALDLSSALKCV